MKTATLASNFHPIKIALGSFLELEGINKSPIVASVHHQSPKDIAQSLQVAATSMDGKVVEALQHKYFKNVYGIQFHTDFWSLFDDGYEFIISPHETVTLDNDSRTFLQQFWSNFSERLKQN